ncbi:lipoprotein [Streptomyces chrestomyceticus JCM 4735]|uniref:Lipoprotein n=1 Tax=Streptomyces chrestomyceticus JCM 4735 TaxID=1306181 RepID=A0A7U9PZ18_9ACTN|nr:hypothetical protein [Streptomyces chrestomyceticus]GCD36938.1 lipoprotein [Streptomyces chrestomyceticus JCM 4735]
MPSLTTTAFRRARRLAAASIVAVAAFSLTACNSSAGGPGPAKSAAVDAPEGGSTGGSSGGSTGGSGGDAGSSGGDAGSSGGDAGSADTGGSGSQSSGGSTGGSGSTGSGTGKGTGTGTGTGAGTGTGTGRKGVDATLVGTLKYLAPGKLTVTPESGTEQAFFVAEDTKVLGAATLCGGPGGQVTITKDSYGTTPCTTDQLDEAAKKNTVKVRATIHRGIATKVEERYHP